VSAQRYVAPSRGTLTANLAVLCFLVLPIVVVLPVSLTDRRYLSLPEHGISFQHYLSVFTKDEWLTSFAQSAAIGLAATTIAVVVGAACAIGCWRLSSRLADVVRTLMLIPLIGPSIVYALGLYRFWIRLDLLDSYLGVIIAHAVTGIPYVVITTSAALAGFDPRLEQAARNLGASPSQCLRLVIVPNIIAGIASGAVFAFIHSWDELVLVLFIASRHIFTLPRRIWDGINDQLDPAIAAVAVLLIILSVILLSLDLTLRRKQSPGES
jgi:putative spermidine/putrescine transport system permease protein